MKIVIPEDVKIILRLLNKNKFKAYVVGGCVRDAIIERVPHDWDICTDALPEDMIKIFSNLYPTIETGIKYGTLTIVINKIPYEVTTFRTDGDYSDNRRPDNVEYSSDINIDLARRDLTINSMAFSEAEGLMDPFNGYSDLNNKLVRCVGNPDERFNEDGLRILRALRFSIQLDFKVEENTSSSMIKNKELLKNISSERISSELSKMLLSGNDIKSKFIEFNELINQVIPEFSDCVDFDQNTPYHDKTIFEHILHSVDYYKGTDLVIKLSLLLHDIGKPKTYSVDEFGVGHFHGHAIHSGIAAELILRRLKFDNKTIEDVTGLVLYHDTYFVTTERFIKKLLNKVGEVQLKRLIKVRSADINAQSNLKLEERNEKIKLVIQILETVLEKQQCFSLKQLAINGKDLIELGIKEGKDIGLTLHYLLDMVIEDESLNTKDKLVNIVRENY